MIRGQLTLINRLGLHARAASELVSLTQQFASEISITHGSFEANGKSIMSLLMLAAPYQSVLDIQIEGADEDEAFESIRMLITNRFREDE